MSEPLNILIATPNAELYYAFEEAFLEFETEITYVTSYCDAIEALQNGFYNLLITEYFLKAGPRLEEASNVRNWEVDTIEHDLEIIGYYRPAIIWLRNLIYKKSEFELFPLGRRLSIEADLLPIKSFLLIPYNQMYSEESMGIEKYFSLYKDLFYPCDGDIRDVADVVVRRIIEYNLIDLSTIA